MTTRVTIHANHGSAVDVTPISLCNEFVRYETTHVAAGTSCDFLVSSDISLVVDEVRLVHEVQPSKAALTEAATAAA
jgi:hypothetical protein